MYLQFIVQAEKRFSAHNLAAVWGDCMFFFGGGGSCPLRKMPGISTAPTDGVCRPVQTARRRRLLWWLGSRVVSVLNSGAEGHGFKSQPLRCRVTVLGKLFTPVVPLFTKQRNW